MTAPARECQPEAATARDLVARLLAMPSSLNDACRTMEEAHGEITTLQARVEAQAAALRSIAGWRSVNISGEYEHGLRDIIRSVTDCAQAALEASTMSLEQRGGK